MTRRERMEHRLEQRRKWAEARRADAVAEFDKAHAAVEGIPFGQPILVGHHSEKCHRSTLRRADAAMARGCEDQAMAQKHAGAAATLEARLEGSIFSDDSDAVQALEARIVGREAQAERIKALNSAIRKARKAGFPEGWLGQLGATPKELTAISRNVEFDWRHEPEFPGYVLSNLRGRITADKERLKAVQRQQAQAAEADAAPGGVVVVRVEGTDYCRVTFAEKPERAVLDGLKAAGFWWRQGSWHGPTSKLPEGL